jgi:hypothetical protein
MFDSFLTFASNRGSDRRNRFWHAFIPSKKKPPPVFAWQRLQNSMFFFLTFCQAMRDKVCAHITAGLFTLPRARHARVLNRYVFDLTISRHFCNYFS